MMSTLPSRKECSKKSYSKNLPAKSSLHGLMTDEEIVHHQDIEKIQSELHCTVRRLMMNHDPYLVAEALEWFVERLRESKRRVSDKMA